MLYLTVSAWFLIMVFGFLFGRYFERYEWNRYAMMPKGKLFSAKETAMLHRVKGR